MFGLLIWLTIGGIIGWLASVAMRTDAQQGILINIVVGIVGSYTGGALCAPFLGFGALSGYLSALLGSVLLVAVVNLVRRGKLR